MKHSKPIKYKLITVLYILFLIALTMGIVLSMFPIFETLLEAGSNAELIAMLQNLGIKGIVAIVAMHIVKVIVFFLPLSPFVIASGLCYGYALGAIISVAGIVIGNALLFVLARLYNKAFTFPVHLGAAQGKFFGKIHSYYEKIKKTETPIAYALIMSLISVVPPGILPYLFANTNISLFMFLFSVAAGSLPSCLFLALMGAFLAAQNYLAAAIILVFYGSFMLVLYLLRGKVIAFAERRVAKKSQSETKFAGK